jgi:hypothetical protein
VYVAGAAEAPGALLLLLSLSSAAGCEEGGRWGVCWVVLLGLGLGLGRRRRRRRRNVTSTCVSVSSCVRIKDDDCAISFKCDGAV